MKTLLLSLLLVPAVALAGEQPDLDIDPDRITVSGISSGAHMATQLHIAYSDLFSGAAMLSGGPYNCAGGSLMTAMQSCMTNTDHPLPVADIAAGFQKAVVDTMVIKCRRAMAQTRCSQLIIAGGVGANLQLREALKRAGRKYGWKVSYPRIEFCTDNGAMIAFAGYFRLEAGEREGFGIRARPRWPLDELMTASES